MRKEKPFILNQKGWGPQVWGKEDFMAFASAEKIFEHDRRSRSKKQKNRGDLVNVFFCKSCFRLEIH